MRVHLMKDTFCLHLRSVVDKFEKWKKECPTRKSVFNISYFTSIVHDLVIQRKRRIKISVENSVLLILLWLFFKDHNPFSELTSTAEHILYDGNHGQKTQTHLIH